MISVCLVALLIAAPPQVKARPKPLSAILYCDLWAP